MRNKNRLHFNSLINGYLSEVDRTLNAINQLERWRRGGQIGTIYAIAGRSEIYDPEGNLLSEGSYLVEATEKLKKHFHVEEKECPDRI